MSKTDERRLRRQLDLARSALRVIHTCATFHIPLREGEMLDRNHVADLCKRTLEKLEAEKEKK